VWLASAYIATGEGGEKSSMGRGTSAIHGGIETVDVVNGGS
jgi:hypothetical protein